MLKRSLSFIALVCCALGLHTPSTALAGAEASVTAMPCPGGWSHGGLAGESDQPLAAPLCGSGVADLNMLDVDINGGTAVAQFTYSVPESCRGKRTAVSLIASVPELGLSSVTELGRAPEGVATIHIDGIEKFGAYRLELLATAGACYVNLEGVFNTVVVND